VLRVPQIHDMRGEGHVTGDLNIFWLTEPESDHAEPGKAMQALSVAQRH